MSFYLNSLELSNLRRFGSNITIEFSPEANIIIAPNGTGKTSVFEALELALTGKVQRLGDTPSSLIRDGYETARVRVNFTDQKSSEVIITKNREAQRHGSLRDLWGPDAERSLSFLLRLTHLMDQKDTYWTTQVPTKSAGEQISSLPIGREAFTARENLIGIRKQITSRLEKLKDRFLKKQKELAEWNRTLEELDQVKHLEEASLIPLIELNDELNSLASSLTVRASIPELSSLKQTLAAVSHSLETQLRQQRQLLARRISLEERIDSLSSVRKAIEVQKAQREEDIKQQGELKTQERLEYQELNELESKLSELAGLMAQAKEQQSKVSELAVISSELKDTDLEISGLQNTISELSVTLAQARAKLSYAQEVTASHGSLQHQLAANAKERSNLLAQQQLAVEWEDLVRSISEVTELADQAIASASEVSEQYGLARETYLHHSREHGKLASKASSMATSVDALRQAVASIAALLDKRNDCPVCLAQYSPGELKRRAQRALETADPALASAIEAAAQLEKLTTDAQMRMEELENSLLQLRRDAESYKDAKGSLEFSLEEILFKLDTVHNNPREARESAEERLKANESQKERILFKQAALEPSPNPESLAALSFEVEKIQGEIRANQGLLNLAKEKRARSQERAEALKATLQNSEPESVGKTIVSYEDLLTNLNQKKSEQRANVERTASLVSAVSSRLELSQRELADLEQQLSSLSSEWILAQFSGNPDREAYSSQVDDTKKSIQQLDDSVKIANRINTELARWETVGNRSSILRRLDLARGRRNYQQYTRHLEDEVTTLGREISTCDEAQQAVTVLTKELNRELNNVRKLVAGVNVCWKTLLGMVTTSELLRETQLELSSRYEKRHAKVATVLHGGRVRTTEVASQAQETELQLTFLLAMAMSRPWSGWRGLLLDDPTQHHDIVHASSVFDLLRNLIAEHQFQLVFATHDALQARFFRRKLVNDGLQVNVWRLRPEAGGVVPELELSC